MSEIATVGCKFRVSENLFTEILSIQMLHGLDDISDQSFFKWAIPGLFFV